MYYGKINTADIANGVGVRVSLFVSGCPHHCKGCFNQPTWNYLYGKPFDFNALTKIYLSLRNVHIRGLSILGGEPLAPENYDNVLSLCCLIKNELPAKDIWLYTGYTWKELQERGQIFMSRLSHVDVLVDGRFVEELKDITLAYRGSSNQRLIDVKKSLAAGTVVLWEDNLNKTR